jgi:membrane fusion protein (multidrug efflux system)
MKTRFVLTITVALAVLAAIFGAKYLQIRKNAAAMAQRPRPVVTVSTTTAGEQEWRDAMSAIGTIESRAGITVRSEVEGRVERVAFHSGAEVKAGDVLIEIESSVELAQLAGLEATARLAAANAERTRELRVSNTNSQAEVDAAEAELSRARAAVTEKRATLAKKRVVAPFDGRLGITQVDPGQFLNKGDPIVELEAIDTVFVDFGLPQQEIARLAPGMALRVTVDSYPGREFAGTIEAVNPRVAAATRNVRVRGVIPNPDSALRPGMFARTKIDLTEVRHVIVLPTAAIVYNPYGDAVYVLTPGEAPAGAKGPLIARQQFVQLGAARGSQVAILGGLKPGDQVVTSGQIKLRNGMPVQVNNTVSPSENPAPTPVEG